MIGFPDLNKVVWSYMSSLRTLNHRSLIFILMKEGALKTYQEEETGFLEVIHIIKSFI